MNNINNVPCQYKRAIIFGFVVPLERCVHIEDKGGNKQDNTCKTNSSVNSFNKKIPKLNGAVHMDRYS